MVSFNVVDENIMFYMSSSYDLLYVILYFQNGNNPDTYIQDVKWGFVKINISMSLIC